MIFKRSWYRFTVKSYQLSCEPFCCTDGNLLPENCTNCKFKSVPSSRRSQAWPPCNKGSEMRVVRKVCINCFYVGARIEHTTHTCQNRWERLNIWEMDCDTEAILL